jgi:hypothetical protein
MIESVSVLTARSTVRREADVAFGFGLDCPPGEAQMQDESSVVDRMQERIDRWDRVGDPRAVFLSCYALMTRNMLDAVDAGEFADAAWVSHLLHHFAGYYFDALDAYEAGVEGAPAVWRRAHDAARRTGAPTLSLLLLGVNAHINYDLVLAVADLLEPEWPALADAGRRARYEDYCRVNDIISQTIDSVQDDILEKREPIMALVDTLFGPVDEWLISRGIAEWREDVWGHAVRRVQTPDEAQREALRLEVEAAAMRWARLFDL